MNLDPNIALGVLTIVGSATAAWGAAQRGQNDVQKNMDEIKTKLDEHIEKDHQVQLDTVDRLARIETKLNRALGLGEHER